jgi:hypothetical protein
LVMYDDHDIGECRQEYMCEKRPRSIAPRYFTTPVVIAKLWGNQFIENRGVSVFNEFFVEPLDDRLIYFRDTRHAASPTINPGPQFATSVNTRGAM